MTVLHELFRYPFMVNAFRAGTIVAVVASLMGWFTVLRRQAFAAHTLALVGFPGAAGATLLGLSPVAGYFGFCGGAALVLAARPRASRAGGYSEGSAVIGSVQALLLASGYLFVNLYRGNLNGVNALLFGNFLGVTATQVLTLLAVGVAALAALGVMARPLFFASIDQPAAEAAGVPVGVVSVVFLLLLGLAVAEASQITGSLLVFALLVLPAATAQALTPRPLVGVLVASAVALASTWLGLAFAYYSVYPAGFFITTLAFGAYVLARAGAAVAGHRAGTRAPAAGAGP